MSNFRMEWIKQQLKKLFKERESLREPKMEGRTYSYVITDEIKEVQSSFHKTGFPFSHY